MNVFNQRELKVIRQAHNIIARKYKRGATFTSPQLVSDYLITGMAFEEQEVFRVMLLDNQNRLIRDIEITRGTIDAASVFPREIAKAALIHNAAAVILAHNHPSGFTKPSQADKQITTLIADALKLVQVRTIDHVIVGGVETYSFANNGDL